MNPNMIPVNPIKELDELYTRDDKVIQFDCEEIANEWFKKRDDETFAKEIVLLQQELQQLDEGKSDHHLISLPTLPLLHTCCTVSSSATRDNTSDQFQQLHHS